MGDIIEKNVDLKHPFKYHAKKEGGGTEPAEAKFITIKAFTMKHIESIAPLKEIVMKALGAYAKEMEFSSEDVEESQENSESDDPAVIESKQMMAIIQMYCGEGDLAKLYVYMKQLLTSGVAYIDGDGSKLNGKYIEELNFSDFENICGEYIGNFIT